MGQAFQPASLCGLGLFLSVTHVLTWVGLAQTEDSGHVAGCQTLLHKIGPRVAKCTSLNRRRIRPGESRLDPSRRGKHHNAHQQAQHPPSYRAKSPTAAAFVHPIIASRQKGTNPAPPSRVTAQKARTEGLQVLAEPCPTWHIVLDKGR